MTLGSLSEERGCSERGEWRRAQRTSPQEGQEVPAEGEEAAALGRTASVAEPFPGPSRGVRTCAALLCQRLCGRKQPVGVSDPPGKGTVPLGTLRGHPQSWKGATAWQGSGHPRPRLPDPGPALGPSVYPQGLTPLARPPWRFHLASLIPLARVVDTRRPPCAPSDGAAAASPSSPGPSAIRKAGRSTAG